MRESSYTTTPIAIVTGLLLVVALTGCTNNGDVRAQSGNGDSHNGGSDVDPNSDGNEDAEGAEQSPPLDHSAALAAGISGDTAIKCLYTYDEQELAQIKMLAAGGEVSPNATVYLNGSAAYWDIPHPGDRLAHILSHEGITYSWKVPHDGLGAKGSQADPDAELGLLTERMKKNASDCAAYTGPDSIFTVPNDITFEFFPG